MHQGDRHRALADGGGDPLHRVGAYVAGDEDAGDAGLQAPTARARASTRGALAVEDEVGPGEQEAAIVALQDPCSQSVLGCGPDEDEQMAGLDPLGLAGRHMAQGQRLEVVVAVDLVDDGADRTDTVSIAGSCWMR